MYTIMTFKALCNNIEPMLWFVAFVVVVLLGLLVARAFHGIWPWQSIFHDGILNSSSGFDAVRVAKIIPFFRHFTFFAPIVEMLKIFASLGLLICFTAGCGIAAITESGASGFPFFTLGVDFAGSFALFGFLGNFV